MKISYKLEREKFSVNDYRTDQNIYETIRKRIEGRKKSKNIEQNLGTAPIPIKDFIYDKLII
jgi:hypothetical protein